jgi:hypothetical protein
MTRLVIPPNTPLLSVERLERGWALWIYTNKDELKRPHHERDGTFLLLDSDGHIDRTTISGGIVVDLIEVMPKVYNDQENWPRICDTSRKTADD